MKSITIVKESGGLRVVAYTGTNKVLLAMTLDPAQIDEPQHNLAGFAIFRTLPGKAELPLLNRISFTAGVSKATTAKTRKRTPSDKAPFQKFRWIDVPPDFTAAITYRIKALYFTGQGHGMKDGPEVIIDVAPVLPRHSKFTPAFTRGYIASQAYAERFHNADIRPKGPQTPDFDTTPFLPQYVWLGSDARRQVADFLADCERDTEARVSVFAYDLDEPDIIAAICRIAKQKRLQAILDNADLHTKPKKGGALPTEVAAAKMIVDAAGAASVKQGKFSRFQHHKVFIKRDKTGVAQRVVFGSMNFSVRGVYVQANNVIVADDPKTAGLFARAFDVAFAGNVKTAAFEKDAISAGYNEMSAADSAELPKFSVALSPHKDAAASLGPMAQRIRAAASSVLFAVMEPDGSGPVLASLRQIAAAPTVFSYGTVETDTGLAVQDPNGAMGAVTGFAALTKNVPFPFTKEFGGGPGKHIHDKFVVVDFNDANPTVFTGSSNLAAGGEEANGDSLAMIEDEAIATMYAIEAVAMFDHFQFRKRMQTAKTATPFTLWFPGKKGQPVPWWKGYYDLSNIKMRDRLLFAKAPLPQGVAAVKTVDWAAIDALAAKTEGEEETACLTPGQVRDLRASVRTDHVIAIAPVDPRPDPAGGDARRGQRPPGRRRAARGVRAIGQLGAPQPRSGRQPVFDAGPDQPVQCRRR